MKKAFTMIEIVFVVVILGILTAVAIPKFGSILEDAYLSKGKETVASIRSSIINERQKLMVKSIRFLNNVLSFCFIIKIMNLV